jgi:hypothetical protein
MTRRLFGGGFGSAPGEPAAGFMIAGLPMTHARAHGTRRQAP